MPDSNVLELSLVHLREELLLGALWVATMPSCLCEIVRVLQTQFNEVLLSSCWVVYAVFVEDDRRKQLSEVDRHLFWII